MPITKKYIAIVFAYLIYGIMLTCILLIVRFPSIKFKQYCARSIERKIPGTNCSIETINYSFPLTIRMNNIRINRTNAPEDKLFSAELLAVRADMKEPGRLFNLYADAYGGQQECRLLIKSKNGDFQLTGLKVHHFNIGQLDYFQKLLDRKFSGFVDITGEYSGNIHQVDLGEAKGSITVQNGSMQLIHPILNLESISLQKTEMELRLKNRTLTLEKGNFHGPEFNATFSGKFQITSPWSRSKFDLLGGLTPLPPLLNRNEQLKNIVMIMQRQYNQPVLPFIISGTLVEPVFRFDS